MIRETASVDIRVQIPGPCSKKWEKFHHKYASKATYVPGVVWDRSAPAIGPFFTDPDGNVILDFASHVGVSILGYNNPVLTRFSREFYDVDPDRYAGCDFIGAWGSDPDFSMVPTPSHLHHRLIDITKQFGFTKSFLSNSGAEAVENAMKLAYVYTKGFGPGVCFSGAFHGRTIGALSCNRSKEIHREWIPGISVHTIPFNGDLDGIDWWDTSFVIVEPIQGEGGYRMAKKDFMSELSGLCKACGVPLIVDEIQSGMGRTGKWWAIEHYGISPDIITAGKALRIGATIGRGELFPDVDGRISSTWGEGNALSSAIGYLTIGIIASNNLLGNATTKGIYFTDMLYLLHNTFTFITDVRGIGLMLAIEFETVLQRDTVLRKSLDRGLLLLGCGEKSIRFLPPIDVTYREIDMALNILEDSLMEVK